MQKAATVGNTLGVTGEAHLQSTLVVEKKANLKDELDVAKKATLNASLLLHLLLEPRAPNPRADPNPFVMPSWFVQEKLKVPSIEALDKTLEVLADEGTTFAAGKAGECKPGL